MIKSKKVTNLLKIYIFKETIFTLVQEHTTKFHKILGFIKMLIMPWA